mgnify:CR=1 FL=1
MVDILAYLKVNTLEPKVTLFNDKELVSYIVDKHKIKEKSIQRSLRYAITVKNIQYLRPFDILVRAYNTLNITRTKAYQDYEICKKGF